MSQVREIIIVGSGPAGYTAAVYAARAGLRPLLFEGSVTAGGALMNTTAVENFPGFPEGVMGPDLMDQMRQQAEKFGAELVTDDVTQMRLDAPVKTVVDSEGTEHQARAVILAMGSAYRKLGLEQEDRLSGRGVSWCATCDGFFFKDKEIVVVGGGDSAMEEATFLSRFGRSVTIVHRRGELRASQIMQERAEHDPKISFALHSQVVAINGQDKVTSVTLRDTVTGETRDLPADGLFIAIGHDPRSELVRDQIRVDESGYVEVEGRSTRTNLDGVFAAGDLVDHTYRQAITAADVTDATFQATVLESDLPVLVDFWADWCSPCRQLSPIVDELADQYRGRLRVAKVDTDTNPVTPATYGVMNLPSLLFFQDGQLVQQLTGGVTKMRLRKAIDEIV